MSHLQKQIYYFSVILTDLNLVQISSLIKNSVYLFFFNLLKEVGIKDAEKRFDNYPHQFSGGMRQRVVISLALCCEPELLIADEPTTALDVSIQSQILDLIKRLTKERNLAVILITHDMGVISETADRVAVMKNGDLVEIGPTKEILTKPKEIYTRSLVSSVPPTKQKK